MEDDPNTKQHNNKMDTGEMLAVMRMRAVHNAELIAQEEISLRLGAPVEKDPQEFEGVRS